MWTALIQSGINIGSKNTKDNADARQLKLENLMYYQESRKPSDANTRIMMGIVALILIVIVVIAIKSAK